MHRQCVGSSNAEDPTVKTSMVASTRPSDRPTLPLDQGVGSSGAEDIILAHLCFDSNWVSDRLTVSSLRPSDHPVLLSFASLSLPFIRRNKKTHSRFIRRSVRTELPSRSVPSAPTLAPMVPSVHPTVSISFLFFRGFDPWKIDYLFNLACGIFASLRPRNVYKDMLNNMVSTIDRVVMNHQNHTQTNSIWVHVRYSEV
jgi:hypothetical protein